MRKDSSKGESGVGGLSASEREAIKETIYLVPYGSTDSTNLELTTLFTIVWRQRWLILVASLSIGIVTTTYALLARPWYESSIVLVPAANESQGNLLRSAGGVLGSIAGIAGIGNPSGSTVESLAVLKSEDFTRDFIAEQGLLPKLFFKDWDEVANKWRVDNQEDQPNVNMAVTYFNERIRTVREDRDTGLVTVGITWIDPIQASEWANLLIARLNQEMRARALAKASSNVQFLQQRLSETNVTSLRESAGSLLESELQKLMLAEGNSEFAFRVVDKADPPIKPVRPKVLILALVGFLLGAFSAMSFVFIRHVASKS